MGVTDSFADFAAWCEGTSPLYEKIARAVADDPVLRAIPEQFPPDRSHPHVLLAAVHHLLLGGDDHPLGEFYAGVTDDPLDPAAHDPVPPFRDFCLSRTDAILELAAERRTQTNEVGRCSALVLAFARIAATVDGPLSLVEVGPSAGLNLLWDRYRYDYGDHGAVGPPESPVRLAPAVRAGEIPVPAELPTVEQRVGIDLHPLDPTDADDVRWLQALTWPEHDQRRRRLDRAAAVAREDPPHVVQGDALDRLPDLVAALSDPVVVYATQVLYQLDEQRQREFYDVLGEVAAGRDLHWLMGERGYEGDEPEIWLEWSPDPPGEERRLGRYEQHGRWLRWQE